jgi:hypothetical protein
MGNKEMIVHEQNVICIKYNMPFVSSPFELKIGIARNIKDGIMPINGLRHPLEGDTTGWYIWAGEEFSEDPDFFVPLHIEHLEQWAPLVLKYLGLPPGTRFLITNDYEDVWEDKSLLKV